MIGSGLFYNEEDKIYSQMQVPILNNWVFTLSFWVKFDQLNAEDKVVLWVSWSNVFTIIV